MACGTLDTVYIRSTCDNIASGIKRFYLANYNPSTTWTYTSTTANAYVVSGNSAQDSFYLIEVRNGTADANEEASVNDQFGSYGLKQSIEIVLIGQSQKNRHLANKLLAGQYTAIVENQAGQLVLMGINGLERAASKGTAGIQNGDENTIRVTLSGIAPEYAPLIDPTYAATLFVTA